MVKKVETLVAIFMVILLPVSYIGIAIARGYFDIDFSVLTVGNLWDIVWLATVVWFGIGSVLIYILMRMGYMKESNGTQNSMISALFIILLWVIAYFKGLFGQTLSSLSLAILWEIVWIDLLILVGIVGLILATHILTQKKSI